MNKIKTLSKKEIILAQIESDRQSLRSIPYLGEEYYEQQEKDLRWELMQIKDKFKQIRAIGKEEDKYKNYYEIKSNNHSNNIFAYPLY